MLVMTPPPSPDFCDVYAFLQVLARHTYLGINSGVTLSITIYDIKAVNLATHINTTLVTKHLKLAAVFSHGITSKVDLV